MLMVCNSIFFDFRGKMLCFIYCFFFVNIVCVFVWCFCCFLDIYKVFGSNNGKLFFYIIEKKKFKIIFVVVYIFF